MVIKSLIKYAYFFCVCVKVNNLSRISAIDTKKYGWSDEGKVFVEKILNQSRDTPVIPMSMNQQNSP